MDGGGLKTLWPLRFRLCQSVGKWMGGVGGDACIDTFSWRPEEPPIKHPFINTLQLLFGG